MGVMVKLRMSEIVSAMAMVRARGANILPSMPCRLSKGRNTRMMTPTP